MVMPDESYTVVCQVNTSARIDWTFNGGDLPSNARVDRQLGRSLLSIDRVKQGNEGQYACLATSPSSAYKGIGFLYMEFNGMLSSC